MHYKCEPVIGLTCNNFKFYLISVAARQTQDEIPIISDVVSLADKGKTYCSINLKFSNIYKLYSEMVTYLLDFKIFN